MFARLHAIAPDLALPLNEVVFLFDMRTTPYEKCEANPHQGSKCGHWSPRRHAVRCRKALLVARQILGALTL